MSTFLEVLKPSPNKRFFIQHLLYSREGVDPTLEEIEEGCVKAEESILLLNNLGLFGTEVRRDSLDFHKFAYGSEDLNKVIRNSVLSSFKPTPLPKSEKGGSDV